MVDRYPVRKPGPEFCAQVSGNSRAGITATAHKIAIIFYTLVTKQIEYDDSIWATRDEHRQKRFEQKLKRQARQLGYELVPVQPV